MGEQYESKLKIVPLDASNQMLAFNFRCGNAVIDSFLKGPQALDPGIGKTFLWLNDKNDRILGFYNIGTGCINYFDGDFMYKMGGSVHINDFALDEAYHHKPLDEGGMVNMSDALLNDCIQRVAYIREHYVGFAFITLQATEQGYPLYRRHDFYELEEGMDILKIQSKETMCIPMYFPMDLEENL